MPPHRFPRTPVNAADGNARKVRGVGSSTPRAGTPAPNVGLDANPGERLEGSSAHNQQGHTSRFAPPDHNVSPQSQANAGSQHTLPNDQEFASVWDADKEGRP